MTGRTYEFVQVDVFTRTPLTGNPLAVFTDARGLIDKEMQALAREMVFGSRRGMRVPGSNGNQCKVEPKYVVDYIWSICHT